MPLFAMTTPQGPCEYFFDDPWIAVGRGIFPAEREPDGVTRTWPQSDRVLVRLSAPNIDAPYEAFARLSRGQWRIEGHHGNWHHCVTHWTPIVEPSSK